jgi:adenosylcobinamide-GDP ribazoletransferase
MHLDGLADTADGLGSGRRGEAALQIMKKSDIGPFGVATLVLVLLLQVAALSDLMSGPGAGLPALLVALVVSRAMLIALCGPRFTSRPVPTASAPRRRQRHQPAALVIGACSRSPSCVVATGLFTCPAG